MKDRKAYEKYCVEEEQGKGCIVEREYLRATYIAPGKLVGRPHDFFGGTADVVAICDDGVHVIQVTSGERQNVTERQRKFNEVFKKDYPVSLEVWHYVKGRKYILNKRVDGIWKEINVLTSKTQK